MTTSIPKRVIDDIAGLQADIGRLSAEWASLRGAIDDDPYFLFTLDNMTKTIKRIELTVLHHRNLTDRTIKGRTKVNV